MQIRRISQLLGISYLFVFCQEVFLSKEWKMSRMYSLRMSSLELLRRPEFRCVEQQSAG